MKCPVIFSGPTLPPSLYPFLILPFFLFCCLSSSRDPCAISVSIRSRFGRICVEGWAALDMCMCVIVSWIKKKVLSSIETGTRGSCWICLSSYSFVSLKLFLFYSPLFLFFLLFLISRLTSATYLFLPSWPQVPLLRSEWLKYSLFWVSGNEYNEWDRGDGVLCYFQSIRPVVMNQFKHPMGSLSILCFMSFCK
jgi:hypothetical protein